MRFLKLTALLLLIVSTSYAQRKNADGTIIDENKKAYYSQVLGYDVKEVFNDKVFDVIADWISTPYKYAGKCSTGVDCSGFINIVYQTAFDIQPGSNSLNMYYNTRHIKKSKLKPGDLVFFRTGKGRVSHVGIYLGSNKFAHASSSNGVMVSDLDETYYAKRFAKGGRVL